MRGGNTHWSGGILRFAFDDPQEIAPLLPGIENDFEDFFAGINALSAGPLPRRPACA